MSKHRNTITQNNTEKKPEVKKTLPTIVKKETVGITVDRSGDRTVTCPACNQEVGTRLSGTSTYPVRHRASGWCPGSKIPVT